MSSTSPNLPVFDSHFHIIDSRFPLVSNQGYLPDSFTCHDYLAQMDSLQLKGGAIVSGSFQAFDQSYLLDALKTLGSQFVGVTQLPETVSDAELQQFNDAGIRAIRFNLKRGGSAAVEHLESVALRIHKVVGWHVELYVDSRHLEELSGLLGRLPQVSIDHLGLSQAGFPTLLRLVEQGVFVKATGFGRVDFDVVSALHDLYDANPRALMFGTDLPSTRAPRPYQDSDLQLILDAFEESQARRILYENAVAFYRL